MTGGKRKRQLCEGSFPERAIQVRQSGHRHRCPRGAVEQASRWRSHPYPSLNCRQHPGGTSATTGKRHRSRAGRPCLAGASAACAPGTGVPRMGLWAR